MPAVYLAELTSLVSANSTVAHRTRSQAWSPWEPEYVPLTINVAQSVAIHVEGKLEQSQILEQLIEKE